ncbi:zinc ribbon domain-containing protein [Microtetraspora niveoalba]|uniref:zinc ribbon domain-containing protein n=1 Tax=Microtetraspora niveoalba TaxID=46175 RepID=UPI00278BED8B|nr:zinc ribbon domain-containing protein [Microtetraspora niveoalba]
MSGAFQMTILRMNHHSFAISFAFRSQHRKGGIRAVYRSCESTPAVHVLPRWTADSAGTVQSAGREGKAARAGVAVIHVDPAYTSQACSSCGHVGERNRPDRKPSPVRRAAPPSMPTLTQPATSPCAVSRAGQ